MAKSKFFRVAVAGTTVDGRTIEPAQIDEMVATFNRETYGPRVNCEHIRGFSPQPPFNCYGDVVALEGRDVELTIDGKTEKRRALYAAIEPTDELVKITNASQKVYSSIEIRDNFIGTGKTGLVGLAVTDNPASIGTERLKFNAIATGNTYSSPIETTIEYEAQAPTASDEVKGFFSELLGLFKAHNKAPEQTAEPKPADPPANDNLALLSALTEGLTKLGASIEKTVGAIDTKVTALSGRFDELKKEVEETPGNQNFNRKPATGGDGRIQADF